MLGLRRMLSTIRVKRFDHVCLAVTDIEASISWYTACLGLRVKHVNSPHFYPTCKESPAFLVGEGGGVAVALLRVKEEERILDHRGAHVAFRLEVGEWEEVRGVV